LQALKYLRLIFPKEKALGIERELAYGVGKKAKNLDSFCSTGIDY
jgi:hypothetical protein